MELDIYRIDWARVMALIARSNGGRAKPIIYKIGDTLPKVFDHYNIDTRNRCGHFLAQACLETDYFKVLEEYASGNAYENRKDLGNTQRGDGARFKGRGIFQTTGRGNYTEAREELQKLGFDVDPVANPEVLEDPVYATWAAGIWWDKNKVADLADQNDPSRMSRAINRGNRNATKAAYHEADRIKLTKAALEILEDPPMLEGPVSDPAEPIVVAQPVPAPQAPIVVPSAPVARPAPETPSRPAPGAPGGFPVPDPGPRQWAEDALAPYEIEAIQQRLWNLGYHMVGLVDGKWGPSTVGAILAFQTQAGITPDGHYGPETRAALADDANARKIGPERATVTADDLRQQGGKVVQRADKVNWAQIWGIVNMGLAGLVYVYQNWQATELPFGAGLFLGSLPPWAPIVAQVALCGYAWAKGQGIINADVQSVREGVKNGVLAVVPKVDVAHKEGPGLQKGAGGLGGLFRRAA